MMIQVRSNEIQDNKEEKKISPVMDYILKHSRNNVKNKVKNYETYLSALIENETSDTKKYSDEELELELEKYETNFLKNFNIQNQNQNINNYENKKSELENLTFNETIESIGPCSQLNNLSDETIIENLMNDLNDLNNNEIEEYKTETNNNIQVKIENLDFQYPDLSFHIENTVQHSPEQIYLNDNHQFSPHNGPIIVPVAKAVTVETYPLIQVNVENVIKTEGIDPTKTKLLKEEVRSKSMIVKSTSPPVTSTSSISIAASNTSYSSATLAPSQLSASKLKKENNKLSIKKLENMAYLKLQNGETLEAIEYLELICKLNMEKNILLDSETINSFTILIEALISIKRYKQAKKYLIMIKNIQELELGKCHSDTLFSYYLLGIVLRKTNKLLEASNFLTKSHQGYSSLFGLNHLATADSSYQLGLLYIQFGDRITAQIYFSLAYHSYLKLKGENDQSTINSMEWEIKCSVGVGKQVDRKKNVKITPQYFNEEIPTLFTNSQGIVYTVTGNELYKSKNNWKNDPVCQICSSIFRFATNRRHHCRICSKSVCNVCSPNKVVVYEFHINDPVRICLTCSSQGF